MKKGQARTIVDILVPIFGACGRIGFHGGKVAIGGM